MAAQVVRAVAEVAAALEMNSATALPVAPATPFQAAVAVVVVGGLVMVAEGMAALRDYLATLANWRAEVAAAVVQRRPFLRLAVRVAQPVLNLPTPFLARLRCTWAD